MTEDGKPETFEEWQQDLRAHSEDLLSGGVPIARVIELITVLLDACDPELWARHVPHYLDAQRAERERERLIRQLS